MLNQKLLNHLFTSKEFREVLYKYLLKDSKKDRQSGHWLNETTIVVVMALEQGSQT